MAFDTRDYIVRFIAESDKARQDIAAVKREILGVEGGSKTTTRSVADLNAAFASQKERISALRREQSLFTDDIKRTVDQIEEQRFALGDSRAYDASRQAGSSALKRTGDIASRLGFGDAGQGLSTIGDLSNIDKLKQDLSGLPPAALAAGAGVAAFTIALDAYKRVQEEARQAALADIAARQNAFKLLSTGSRDEIQLKINQLDEEKRIADEATANAQKLFSDLRANIQRDLGSGVLAAQDVASAFGLAAGTFTGTQEALAAAQKEAARLDIELGLLSKSSGLTAQTTEQAAAAEARLNLERGYSSRLIAEANRSLEQQNLAVSGTERQVLDLISSMERQNKVYEVFKAQADEDLKYLQAGTEAHKSATDASKYFGDAINANNAALKQATNFTLDAVRANDERAAAEKRALEATREIDKIRADVAADAIKQAEALQSQADKTAAAYDTLADSFKQANLDQAARDAQQDAKRARTNRDENVKHELETSAKIEDINLKRVEDYIAAEQRRADSLEQIQRDLAYGEKSAIADRNAVALAAVRDAAAKQTEEANAAAKKDRKTADDTSEKARKDLQRDLILRAKLEANQRAAEIREDRIADDIEYSNRKAAYYRQQDLLASKNRAELLQLNNAYTKELTAQQKALTEIEKLDKEHYATVIGYAKTALADIKAILKGGSSTGGGSVGLVPGPITGPGGFGPTPNAFGSDVFGGVGAYLRPSQGFSRDAHLTLNINALSKTGAYNQAMQAINDVLTSMGA